MREVAAAVGVDSDMRRKQEEKNQMVKPYHLARGLKNKGSRVMHEYYNMHVQRKTMSSMSLLHSVLQSWNCASL